MKRLAGFIVTVMCALVCAFFICGCSAGRGGDGGAAGEPNVGGGEDMPVITGVGAESVYTVYDGAEHSIDVTGLEDGDEVSYSADGVAWSKSNITYTDVGEYTVHYKVMRAGHTVLLGSAKVEIAPREISGITAEDLTVTAGGEINPILTGLCAGDVVRYSVDGGEYTDHIDKDIKEGEHKVVYKVERANHEDFIGQIKLTVNQIEKIVITVNGERYEIPKDGEKKQLIAVEFDGKATVKVNGEACAVIENVNYCESITGVRELKRDYIHNSVECEMEAGSAEVLLSKREVRVAERIEESVLYDGTAHDINAKGVVYLDVDGYETEKAMYTEVGEYVDPVAVVADGYLPSVTECVVKVLPDISGVYVSESGVLEIEKLTARLNNVEVIFEHGVTCGSIAAKRAEYGDCTIIIDGEEYVKAERKLLAIAAADGIVVLERDAERWYELRVEGGTLTVSDMLSFEVLCTADWGSGVCIGGAALIGMTDGTDTVYYMTESDICDSVVAWLTCEC